MTQAGKARPAPGRGAVHRLKIGLRGAKPPIWRRVEVPSTMTLRQLHQVIQASFDWEESHLWVFETPVGAYGVKDPDLGHRNAGAKRLNEVAPLRGDGLLYLYDFGDNWEHHITVEDVLPAQDGVNYPRCVAGRRAAPPEDCGGIWGYEELISVLADPAHPEHANYVDWLGLASPDEFDPAAFDMERVNRDLGEISGPRRGR